MNWYLDNGKESDVIVSSRIRLARNLKDMKFKEKMSKEEQEKLLEKIKFITPSIGYGLKFIRMKDIDDLDKLCLLEKNLITPEMISSKNDETGAILLNDEENICILINEEDHIKIQIFDSGLDLKNTMSLAREIDEKLDEILHFACNKKYGYLTSCPTNIGTGLRASVMVHLPALKITGNISKILHIVNSFGMTITGVYGEDSQTKSDMFLISNNQTLGITEDEIINNLENITKKVIEQERLARKYLGKNKVDIEDRVYRAYGIISNAVKIGYDEFLRLISEVKLGVDLGIIKELTDSKVKKIELYSKPANLQKYVGNLLNAYDRDIKRAEIIKQIIKN